MIARIEELRASGRLPSPSGVALAVLKLTREDSCSTADISKVIQVDPALSGRILKRANAASMGNNQPIVSINDAVVRLGIRVVSQLALGFSLLMNYREGHCHGFDYDDFWSRSLVTGIAAKVMSDQLRIPNSDEMFTCGLLSQVGRLAIASVHPDRYSEILRTRPDNKLSTMISLEQREFALDHNFLSAALLQDWQIPDRFCEAVHVHENPSASGLEIDCLTDRLARVLQLARSIAVACMGSDEFRRKIAHRIQAFAEKQGISGDVFPSLYQEIMSEWVEWGENFDIPTDHSIWPVVQKAAAQEVPKGEALSENNCEYDSSGPVVPETKQEIEAVAQAAKSLKILVVDDDPIQLKMIEVHLRKAGHVVSLAEDGRQALAMILQDVPQLIITDWNMPEMNGVELCKALRSAESTSRIYIIMLTGREDEESLVEAFESGVDDYIVKPFTRRSLIARIRAGERIVRLQEQVERDKEAIKGVSAQLSVVNRRLETASLTDSLTTLPNRRMAMRFIENNWIQSRQTGQRFACILIDIDFFKKVNDTLGHDVGDIVLKETSTAMRTAIKKGDLVSRFGGEEFLVVLPDLGLAGAANVAERLRLTVENNRIAYNGGECQVTVSLGVAEFDPADSNFQEMIKRSDLELYRAKAEGRNRVCAPITIPNRSTCPSPSPSQERKPVPVP